MDIVSSEEVRNMLDSRNLVIAPIQRRLAAYSIDVGIVFLISCLILVATYTGTWHGLLSTDLKHAVTIMWFSFWLSMPLYYAICNPIFGKTVGCRFSKIEVISLAGQEVGFAKAYIRGLILATVTIGLFPFIIALHSLLTLISWKRSELKRTWWDLGTGTIVVQEASK